jgi:putative endopeptidase
MWRVALSTSVFLSDDIRERRLEYLSALSGVKKYQDRWKECTSLTSSYLSIASSALYIRSYFNQKSKEDALELVNMIRDEFVSTLKSIDWMDDETREAALKKAKKMKNFIAYPDELKDDEKLIEYYQDLDIKDDEFFKSFLKMNRFAAKKAMVKFREPVDKDDWRDHANVAVINAFYSFLENSIRENSFKNCKKILKHNFVFKNFLLASYKDNFSTPIVLNILIMER